MNWHKEIKLGAPPPIFDKYHMGYLDIAHYSTSRKDYLWFIDENYQFHIIRIEMENFGHAQWSLYQTNRNTMIASGKYNEESRMASMVLKNRHLYHHSLYKKQLIKERVEKILDKQLNNPIIKVFE